MISLFFQLVPCTCHQCYYTESKVIFSRGLYALSEGLTSCWYFSSVYKPVKDQSGMKRLETKAETPWVHHRHPQQDVETLGEG